MLAPREVNSPARFQRLANVTLNHLGAVGVDVEVETRKDGRVAVVMPTAWLHLFLANLTAQAQAIKEKLQKAAWEARIKDATLQVELAHAAEEWDRRQVKIQTRYKKLVAGGASKREAIRLLKTESHGVLSATIIQTIVESADPRQKRARLARNDRIVALRQRGMKLREIAAQEGVSKDVVVGVLRKGGQGALPNRTRLDR